MKKKVKNFNLLFVTKVAVLFSFVIGGVRPLVAQQNQLTELLQLAEKNYPSLKSKNLQVQAAAKGVAAIKTTLAPSLEAAYNVNYATYNNITGMAYPQFLIPISGPPSSDNTYSGVFGSSASLLLNWQPITFGQRSSQIELANKGLQYAKAGSENELFQHKIKVIDAYLGVLMSMELVKVFKKNMIRTEANLQMVKELVISGVRPGVDTALLKTECSKAKVELLNAQKYKEQTHIYLSQLLGAESNIVISDSLAFSKLPLQVSSAEISKHPLVTLANSSIEISLARKKTLARTMLPTLGIWGTTYARGSGIAYNNVVNANDGLQFQRFNYGVGVQLSVPLLQFARIRPQLQQQSYLIQANQEMEKETELQLKKQNQMADTTLATAFAVVKESPLFLESARFSYNAVQARYQSGLSNYSDFVQAQYSLLKAETDDKIANIGVWKAVLNKAAVAGDLNIFINQAK